MKKLAVLAISGLVAVGVVSCSSSQQACADPLSVVAKPGGSGSSGGAPKSPPARTPSAGKPSSGGASSGKSGSSGQSKTAAQSKAASASKPSSKPSAADASAAKSSKPATVSRGGSYSSPVTGNTYIFHSSSYYRTPGLYVDIFDIYNPYNYWYYPNSPYYGMPYRYAGACGQPDKQVNEQKENINITIDNDGKIVSAEDKNPKDPDLEKPDPNDATLVTAPGTDAPTSAP